MTFLAMILALVLSMVWSYRGILHQDDWYARLKAQVAGLGLGEGIAVAIQVGLPVLAVTLLLEQLERVLFGLPWIVAASFLLLYSLGRVNTGQWAERYRSQCRRGDFEAALLDANEQSPDATDTEGAAPHDPQSVHLTVQRALLQAEMRGWFGVLFYFVLLGPAAALAYRLLDLSAEPGKGHWWMNVADWLPSRLAAASFMVMGNFVDSVDECYEGFRHPEMSANALLLSVARAAVSHDKIAPPVDGFGDFAARQNEELSALVHRGAICWLLVISLWAMAG
ncbi:hypothetical protein EY643_04735 [Halioglobus maricola]|uniref:Regulatory signaling modulator protein AmpE n=1 Tax=Halioglobus maricola TaxID=2601894 RepID=A0A5P9NHK9_9GAMM|nr:regulatory signaling modulator protein AmpE [Halioglobus maricola]QFU75006.1 hypothetical protein EY643_04735 [Halioglobus maricola]